MKGNVCSHVPHQWRIQDFPEEGAPTLQRGAPTYNFAKFCQRLHEIEIIWTPGGRASKILLCRSATAHCTEKHPSPRSMIKLVHYELRTVGKRAVGILLESFLVLQVPTFTNYTGTGLTGSRGRTAVTGSPAPVSSTITNSRPRDSTTS